MKTKKRKYIHLRERENRKVWLGYGSRLVLEYHMFYYLCGLLDLVLTRLSAFLVQ